MFPDDSFCIEEIEEGEEKMGFWEALGGEASLRSNSEGTGLCLMSVCLSFWLPMCLFTCEDVKKKLKSVLVLLNR